METMTSIVDRFLSLKSQKTLDKTIDESLCNDKGVVSKVLLYHVSEASGDTSPLPACDWANCRALNHLELPDLDSNKGIDHQVL